MGKQKEKPADQIEETLDLHMEENSDSLIDEDHLLDNDGAESVEAVESSSNDLRQKLEAAELKAQENWDKMVRMQAEMENQKRRIQKDLESAHKFALEKFAKELLNVIDSLELGIQASTGTSPEVIKLREGSELTLKQFQSTLAKFNIVAIEALGQPFNPDHHQAISIQPNADVEPNTVLNEFQKGYLLNERLLRPSMVVVSKAVEQAPDNLPKIDEQA